MVKSICGVEVVVGGGGLRGTHRGFEKNAGNILVEEL